MRIAPVLVIALAIFVAGGQATAGSNSTNACKVGTVAAVIGGKHVCLGIGQACKAKFAKQYRRYGFACRAGRLVKKQRPVPMTPVTITLAPVNASGVTGRATLTPIDAETTRVDVHIDNPPPGSLPAHIHFGTCATGGGIFFGLTDVVGGESTTEALGIATLRRGAFHIEVHDHELTTTVACGDIPWA